MWLNVVKFQFQNTPRGPAAMTGRVSIGAQAPAATELYFSHIMMRSANNRDAIRCDAMRMMRTTWDHLYRYQFEIGYFTIGLPCEGCLTSWQSVRMNTCGSWKQKNTWEYNWIHENTTENMRIQKNTREYKRVQKNTKEYMRMQEKNTFTACVPSLKNNLKYTISLDLIE